MKNHIIFLMFISLKLGAQIGFPESFSDPTLNGANFRNSMSSYVLPNYNNAVLRAQEVLASSSCTICNYNSAYGIGNRNPLDLKLNAQYFNPNFNNGKLWIMKITSPSALGLQLYFKKFNLPEESSLFVYNSDHSIIMGPYSSNNNPTDVTKPIQFGVPPIFDKEIYLEYYQSNLASFDGQIILDNIIHVFNTSGGIFGAYGSSATCQKDIACTVGWEAEINSVALILLYNSNNNKSYSCTGAMLNNSAQDGRPLLLSAGHCFNENTFNNLYDPSTMQFIFDYQNQFCLSSNPGGPVPPQTKVIYGANILSKDPLSASDGYPLTSDYLLMELNTSASEIQQKGICYSGWDIKDPFSFGFNSSSVFSLIHHPEGDVKKFSSGDNFANAPGNLVWSSNDFYSFKINYGGANEPGSSGGPIFNPNHRIIATNTGYTPSDPDEFPDYCDNTDYTPYLGKLKRHWILGSFQQWLDPLNITSNPNNTGINTYCPYPPGSIVGIGGPVTSFGPISAPINKGFSINGKNGLAIFCPTNIISLASVTGGKLDLGTFDKEVHCSSSDITPVPILECFVQKQFLGIPTKCACRNTAYKLSIIELDNNLNQTGFSYSTIETFQDYDGQVSTVDVNLSNKGWNLQPGKFYSVVLESALKGYWDYSSRIMYILPTALQVNSGFIGTNMYAQNSITLQNASVYHLTNFIEISASDEIIVKPSSSLNSAKLKLQSINCSTFRMNTNTDSNKPSDGKNNSANVAISNYEESKNELKILSNSDNLSEPKVYPNPTSKNAIVELPFEVISTSIVHVILMNSQGSTVYNEEKQISSKYFNLESESLKPGLYFAKVSFGNQTWTLKLIKN